jgi:hypothetical protein
MLVEGSSVASGATGVNGTSDAWGVVELVVMGVTVLAMTPTRVSRMA